MKRFQSLASDIPRYMTYHAGTYWILLFAVVLDVWTCNATASWGLSASHLAGFFSGSLLLTGVLQRAQRSDYAWLAALWLLLSALRGGFAGSLLALHTPPMLAILLTSLCSLGLLQLSYIRRTHFHTLTTACLWACGYLVLLRLSFLGLPELIFEEAYYWDYAQHLDYGYLDHPLITAWLIKLSTLLLGNHEFAVRFPAFICWFITGYYVYQLVKAMLDRSHAIMAVLLATALPAYFFFGFFMSPDAPLTACWAAALYYSYRILHKQEARAWVFLGISLGLGMSSKYTIALLGAALVLLLLADKQQHHWWRRKEPYLALVIVLCLFSPVIVWNALHDWASFTFQSEERAKSGFVFSTPRFLGNILLFASPIGVLSLVALLRERIPLNARLKLQGFAVKPLWQIAFLGIFPILVFGLLSVARTSKLNWTGPCWLALLPLFSLLISRQQSWKGLLGVCQRAWPAMLAALCLVYAVGMHYLALGLPGLPYPQNTHLLGWKATGAQIEQLVEEEMRQSGKPVLVVGMDRNRIASGLAFYRSLAQAGTTPLAPAALTTTSQNLFGDNGLMFAWWFHQADQDGKTLLLVSDDAGDLDAQRVRQYSHSQGEIQHVAVTKNGKPTGILYYRFVYGYRPAPSGK